MRPLDIAFVSETYPPEVNGVAMTVGRLVAGLRELGHRVSVVRPRQGKSDAGAEDELALPGLPLPGYPGLRFGLPAGGRLARQWRHRRPDLVHVVTEGPLGWSAVSTARRLGIPVTSGFHTNFDRYSTHYGVGWMRPAVAAYLRALHRRTRATMVPTAALAADLAGEGLAGVRVVGRGVDTALYDPARRSAALRASWGARGGAPVCLYVGRLAPEKNLALVRRSFAAIRTRQPGARMVWVGDGPSARELADEHPDHHFAGLRLGEDLAAHYASADLFLFPSLTETYGNVVAEAMASGVPVLAYHSAAAAELISDGADGRTVPPGDEKSYIDGALALAAAPERLREMGHLARQAMLPRGWGRVVESFENVAREALAG
ncbi:glycosyltransferase family 1 protein [Dechloromonas sp. H13]|uniref:glycosyltransferase family 4 protein n=1 Tax=Dechloromonas sp. H13 TaxID=2570193 RepID=UPI00129274B0|nr:glycosyltransferase family 1 protein [Dechloromonas sp. H13]